MSRRDELKAMLIKENFVSIVDNLNHCLSQHGFDFQAATPELPSDSIFSFNVDEDIDIHRNEIESAVRLLKSPSDKITCGILGVQGGKTNSAIIFIVLACCQARLQGRKMTYLYVMPGNNSLMEGVQDPWFKLTPYLSRIVFETKGKTTTFFEVMSSMYPGDHRDACIVAMTSDDDLKNKVQLRIREAKEKGWGITIVWDEFHEGDNGDGVANKYIGDFLANFMRKVRSKGDRVCGISATPYTLCALKEEDNNLVHFCQLKHADSYVGYNFFDGGTIDDKVQIRTPQHWSFAMAQRKAGLEEIPIRWDALKDFSNLSDPRFRSLRSYERAFAKNILTIYKTLAADYKNKYFPGMKTSVGGLVRVALKNELCERIAKEIKDQDNNVKIIKFYNSPDYSKVQKEIRGYSGDGSPFIVIVSSGARMGNRFPCEVGVMIDCTRNYSTTTAATQGLAGRAANNKGMVRHVVMSQKNYEWVVGPFLAEMGRTTKSPGRRVVNHSRIQGKRYFRVNKDTAHGRMLISRIGLFLGAVVVKNQKRLANNPKAKMSGSYVERNFFNRHAFDEIESICGEKFLFPGEIPDWDSDKVGSPEERLFKYIEKDGKVYFSIRNAKSASTKGDLGGTAMRALKDNRGYVVQVYVHPTDGIVSAVFVLKHGKTTGRLKLRNGKNAAVWNKGVAAHDVAG